MNAKRGNTFFFTSAAILALSSAVNAFSAKAVGHMGPSSRFALCRKSSVAYLVLTSCTHRNNRFPRSHSVRLHGAFCGGFGSDRRTDQRSSWMRIRVPAGSRTAQSRTPCGCSVGSWTTSAPPACTLAKVPSRSLVARRIMA